MWFKFWILRFENDCEKQRSYRRSLDKIGALNTNRWNENSCLQSLRTRAERKVDLGSPSKSMAPVRITLFHGALLRSNNLTSIENVQNNRKWTQWEAENLVRNSENATQRNKLATMSKWSDHLLTSKHRRYEQPFLWQEKRNLYPPFPRSCHPCLIISPYEHVATNPTYHSCYDLSFSVACITRLKDSAQH